MVSRASRAEWIIARREAKVSSLQEKLTLETRVRRELEQKLATGKLQLHLVNEVQPMMAAYVEWYDRYVAQTLGTEMVVIGDGYAGRLDHLCELKDGRIAITDTKSQDISTKKGRFNYYPEWVLQLAAYAGAINRFPGPAEGSVDALLSICISS